MGDVWDDARQTFSQIDLQTITPTLIDMNNFRNQRVVQAEDPITHIETAEKNLLIWVKGLFALWGLTA